MTKKKDPEIERIVQGFMYRVDRRDRIVRTCKKPTTCDRFWEGGYRAAMGAVVYTLEESFKRTDNPAHALADALAVVRGALEASEIDGQIDAWITGTVDSLAWPVSPSGY